MVNVKPFLCISLAIPALMACSACGTAHAQLGTSSMSYNATAASASNVYDRRSGVRLPLPQTIRIEEFVNYHEHDIPRPDGEQDIRLSVRHVKINDEETLVQIGISTPQQYDTETMPPLNLVLVIDQSGSMVSENRIGKVKNAIDALIDRFRKNDRIAIVGFSNKASVILDSCRKSNRQQIRDAIDSLCAEGSTNLHDGLQTGYKIATEHLDPDRTNRVLFLTDGNANVGITEPDAIAEMSRKYNRKGISLSTIGVGGDFNQELLTTLADAGRGLAHFVGDQDDIEKIFVNDFESLLAPIAHDVRLKLDFRVPAEEVKIFGYSQADSNECDCDEGRHDVDDDDIVLQLKNLNYGVTQVVMATIPTTRNLDRIKATLLAEHATKDRELKFQARSEKATCAKSKSIKRDYAIAVLASGIKRAAKRAEDDDVSGARRALTSAIRKAERQLDERKDENVSRVKKIAERYVEVFDCQLDR